MKNILIVIVLAALMIFAIAYPFLPGEYDPMALPVSIIVQSFGLIGLPLVIIGAVWLLIPRRAFIMAIVSLVYGVFVMLMISLLATLSVGKIFGVLTLLVWTSFFVVLIPKIGGLRTSIMGYNPAPLYLITLPVVSLVCQLLLVGPLTDRSRDRAIAMAAQYIDDIELYHSTNGSYPVTMHAQHKDYQTNVVGVERYFYSPQDNGYSLSFEQPRFLMDRFGTREWVVYSPGNNHEMYSHTEWHMRPGNPQGWYASGLTKHEKWKWFYFD